jgi:hypothetical protein
MGIDGLLGPPGYEHIPSKGKHELKELWVEAKRWPMYCTIFVMK